MGARLMRSLVALAAVVVLGTTVGTAVYAMVDDEPDPPAVSRQPADESLGEDGGGPAAAACLEGATDCQDTFVDDDGGLQQCATDQACRSFDADCPPDNVCTEPAPIDSLTCPEGLPVEECFPDGVPAGYECVTLESFPVQVKCYPVASCTSAGDGTVSTLPAPTDVDEPADPTQVDPAPTPGDDAVPPTEPCLPGDCAEDADGVVYCKPISDDPCYPQPDPGVRCVPADPCDLPGDDPNTGCLPPDCAISSDGVVSCPVPLPQPCVTEPDPNVVPDSCEVPPSDCTEGDPSLVHCLPLCPEQPDVPPEECTSTEPPSEGGGSSGGAPAVEATVVPAE